MQKYLNMKSVKQAFKTVDIGGVHPVHTINKSENTYKSFAGGLVSFLILVLSASYTIYVLYNWYSGYILPISQTSKRTINYEEFSFDYNPISWVFTQPSQSTIDPFQNDQVILIPIVQIISDINLSPPDIIQGQEYLQNTQRIRLNGSRLTQNLTMAHNPIQDKNRLPFKNETQYVVTFLKCTPLLLKPNQTCANSTIMTDYFNIGGKTIVMSVHFQEFEQSSLTFVARDKAYYFVLDDSQGLYTQVVLQTKNMTVSSGFLFQEDIHKNFLYSVEVQTQTISKNEFVKLYGIEGYAIFLIRLDSVKQFEDISFPTLGQVGAQIGSIINVILWMKLLIIFYNTRQYQNKLVDVIMTYSQIKETNEYNTENINNPFVEVQNTNQVSNTRLTAKQIKLSKELALEKTNIFNVHLELAKMRNILDQIVEKQQIQIQQDLKSHIIPNEQSIIKMNDNQIQQSRKSIFYNQSSTSKKVFQLELKSDDEPLYDNFKIDINSPKDPGSLIQQQTNLISIQEQGQASQNFSKSEYKQTKG